MIGDTPISRILREARAAVHTPQRPETPGSALLDRRFYSRVNSRLQTPVSLSPMKNSVVGASLRRRSLPEPDSPTPQQTPPTDKDREILWAQINTLVPLMRPDSSTATVATACAKVSVLLDGMGPCYNPSDRRMRLLYTTLHQLLEHADATIRVHAIVLVSALAAGISQPVAQALYRLSKEAENDSLLTAVPGLLSNLVTVCRNGASANRELLTTCVAVLKNLSGTQAVQDDLVSLGALDALAHVADECVRAIGRNEGVALRNRVDTIIQVTGCVRNICSKAHCQAVIRSGILRALFPAIGHSLAGYREVVYNTSRIIARLCLEEECRELLLASTNNITAMCNVVSMYVESGSIVARFAYTLSVLLEPLPPHSDANVMEASRTCCAATQYYIQNYTTDEKEARSTLSKLIRALINISVHHESGVAMATDEVTVSNLITLVGTYGSHEDDITLHTIVLLTNLSFYSTGVTPNVVHASYESILPVAWALLLAPNKTEATVESCRLISNLCVSHTVKDWLCAKRVDEAIGILLHHVDTRVMQNALGVLLNLSSTRDAHGRIFLENDDVLDTLRGIIMHCCEEFSLVNVAMTSLCAKILINLGSGEEEVATELSAACAVARAERLLEGDTEAVVEETLTLCNLLKG